MTYCYQCEALTMTGVDCLDDRNCRSCSESCSTCGTVKE